VAADTAADGSAGRPEVAAGDHMTLTGRSMVVLRRIPDEDTAARGPGGAD
jgi:hypothetical protein